MTLCDRLAAFFRERSGIWIDGRALAPVAGSYGWRTRVSDLRRPPYSMQIENRQRQVTSNGDTYAVSEHRYVPSAGAQTRPPATPRLFWNEAL